MRVGGLDGTVPRVTRDKSHRRVDPGGRGEGARRCLGGAFVARASRTAPLALGRSGSVQGAPCTTWLTWPPTPLLGLSIHSRKRRETPPTSRRDGGKQDPLESPSLTRPRGENVQINLNPHIFDTSYRFSNPFPKRDK